MKVLIVEDEYNLADAISSMLEREKYQVEIRTDGQDGLMEALTGVYDLIILDVMLPHIDGFKIISRLRAEKLEVKVIMLTAKSDIDDKMQGFNLGADDYLTKPFHMDELVARVNLQLRKNGYGHNLIIFDDLELDTKKLVLKNTLNNLSIEVIGKEFLLLELLIKNPYQILEKELIFNKIWGYDSDSEINTLEAYISFLRKKLKLIKSRVVIKAVRNMGYKMEALDE